MPRSYLIKEALLNKPIPVLVSLQLADGFIVAAALVSCMKEAATVTHVLCGFLVWLVYIFTCPDTVAGRKQKLLPVACGVCSSMTCGHCGADTSILSLLPLQPVEILFHVERAREESP